MTDEFECAVLYTDLDSLFDTRLATIHSFGLEVVEGVVANGYFNRVCDEFHGVETEAFLEAYEKRDIVTLKQALITPVVELVNLFAKQTLVAVVASPFRRQPKVFLNTYPYKLDEVLERSIILGLVAATGNKIDVELGYMSPEELSPSFVKANFVQMIMYSYNHWLDVHSENKNFTTTQCPMVTLFGPALMRSQAMVRQMQGQDVFGSVETLASLFIKLTILPAKLFSVDAERLVKINKPT